MHLMHERCSTISESIPRNSGDCATWPGKITMNKELLIYSLLTAKICEANDIRGASPEDVAALEKVVGRKLPLQYREFLLGIGFGAGRFMQGTDIFLPSIEVLKSDALELLRENNECTELAEEVFVFSMHQGYEFTYFNISAGDDPPIYQYVEGNGPPVLTWNSFSDFLRDLIHQYAKGHPE